MNKVGAVVVTYRPSQEVQDNIAKIAEQVDIVYVVDNTEDDRAEGVAKPSASNVILVRNGVNKGIATALNQGIDNLVAYGVDDLFLFDQDSVLPLGFVENMLGFRAGIIGDNYSQIIVSPNFVDVNSGTSARFAVLKGWRYRSVTCADSVNVPLLVSFAITSGTLLNREIWKRVGRMRDDYFIDHVDSEYCLRAASREIHIAVNCEVTLNHAIGQRTVHKIMGVTIKPNNHSHLRRYYITRNGIRVMLDYGREFPSLIGLSIARLGHEFLSIVFFEQNRVVKLRAMWRGMIDGIWGRMGPARFL